MPETNKSPIIPTLILIARPAAGKSEIIDFLQKLEPADRRERFYLGKLEAIDDFPYLWRWFEEDALLSEMGKPRLYTDQDGYFKHRYLWVLLIKMINLEYDKFIRESINPNEYSIIIEFSRGKEHGGYEQALPLLSHTILENASILYVDVPWEESLRKNRKRFNPERPDSILEHSLPDLKLKRLYRECDFRELAPDPYGFLEISGLRVPYTIFDNSRDLTTSAGKRFEKELADCMKRLWELNHQA